MDSIDLLQNSKWITSLSWLSSIFLEHNGDISLLLAAGTVEGSIFILKCIVRTDESQLENRSLSIQQLCQVMPADLTFIVSLEWRPPIQRQQQVSVFFYHILYIVTENIFLYPHFFFFSSRSIISLRSVRDLMF